MSMYPGIRLILIDLWPNLDWWSSDILEAIHKRLLVQYLFELIGSDAGLEVPNASIVLIVYLVNIN